MTNNIEKMDRRSGRAPSRQKLIDKSPGAKPTKIKDWTKIVISIKHPGYIAVFNLGLARNFYWAVQPKTPGLIPGFWRTAVPNQSIPTCLFADLPQLAE
ncbi:MAG: hypothetical protein IPF56_06410 [Chloroflexi bacterium]|nr:hypothetical protein [Chloroflexota bacterium]